MLTVARRTRSIDPGSDSSAGRTIALTLINTQIGRGRPNLERVTLKRPRTLVDEPGG